MVYTVGWEVFEGGEPIEGQFGSGHGGKLWKATERRGASRVSPKYDSTLSTILRICRLLLAAVLCLQQYTVPV